MTTYTVSSGVTSNGLVLQSGDSETVLAGGEATNTAILSGALLNVSSGGTASGTDDYGEEQIFGGGTAIAITVEAGGVLYVPAGGTGEIISGAVVLSRGLEQIAVGTDTDAIVSSGGVQWATTSASVISATLSGGTQILGGLTSSTQFGALATAGGTATGTVVDSGGEQFVGTGATASGTVLNSGGQQIVGGSTEWTYYYTAPTGTGLTMSTNLSGGVAVDTTVNSGGVLTVHSGGTTTGTITYGEEAVGSGGVVSSTTVEAGGILIAGSSTQIGTVVESRGLEQLGLASVDSGTTVSAGGTQWLYSTAAATNTTLNGGIQVIGGVTSSPNFGALTTTGGTATGTVVNNGGAEYVGTDATASGTVVNSGGTQQVGGSTEWSYYYQVSSGVAGATMSTNLSGGVASNTTVEAGGVVVVSSGGLLISATDSGQVTVYDGGVASSTTVNSFDGLTVSSGGAANGTVLTSGGQLYVETGGTASGTTINTSGLLYIQGGTATGTTDSGSLTVASGGVASNTTVLSGGGISVLANGTVNSATIEAGGRLTEVASGTLVENITDYSSITLLGSATNITIGSGGAASFTGSANVTSVTISNGGTATVGAAATAADITVNSGGVLNIVSTDTGITNVDLLSGGEVVYSNVTYSAGATATLNAGTDVLTVTNGASTYTLQLEGDYTGELFHVANVNGEAAVEIGCFYAGTRLAAAQGEIEVQDVITGTNLRTADGRVLPVRWVGRSEISVKFGGARVLPIRIKAGALADGVPARDLLVSPDHAIFLNGVLVQAAALVNNITILRETNVPESFTYYHVELETHELLLAEGTAAESFVDNIDRMSFSNWAEHEEIKAGAPIREMDYPRAKAARQVPAAILAMLGERAGLRTKSAAA